MIFGEIRLCSLVVIRVALGKSGAVSLKAAKRYDFGHANQIDHGTKKSL